MVAVFINTCFFNLKDPGVRGRELGLKNLASSGLFVSSIVQFESGGLEVNERRGEMTVVVVTQVDVVVTDIGIRDIGVIVKAGGDFWLRIGSDSGNDSVCLLVEIAGDWVRMVLA